MVLLGASNLTRGISTVIETSQRILGGPLDVMAALGHGRSYGMPSSVLGRGLPGILGSRLWDDLADRDPLPTYGLITDIGNDILYGSSATELLSWIGECVERLTAHASRIVITELPMASIESVGPLRFGLLRQILFPNSPLTLDLAKRHSETVHSAIEGYRTWPNVAIAGQAQTWYGLDPIHIRRAQFKIAWPLILNHWRCGELELPPVEPRGSLLRWTYLRTRVPDQRSLFGFMQRRVQPCGQLSDGTFISLY